MSMLWLTFPDLTNSAVWMSFDFDILEIVLGVDNIILSLITTKIPRELQKSKQYWFIPYALFRILLYLESPY